MKKELYDSCVLFMKKLCQEISDRSVGTEGNREATQFFRHSIQSQGWTTISQKFDAMDWIDEGARLQSDRQHFEVFASPYSLGFLGTCTLASASTLSELQRGDFKDKIVLLHGELAQEQLMPKNFVFYNPESHQQIIAGLEESQCSAIICSTGRNAALAGGVYPFPLIEDGDFDIPSVYMTEEEGKKLTNYVNHRVALESNARRVPGKGYNVMGIKGSNDSERIVITAHIDAKKGTPGAIDNATGVTVLLLLSILLRNYNGNKQIELVAFNGEDYYAVPGQMEYIKLNATRFNTIQLNINIDGAAYSSSNTSFSFMDTPDSIKQSTLNILRKYPSIVHGAPWVQGDHSIFLQHGVPAIAVSSEWFVEHIDTQDITHTPKDNLQIVNYDRIIETATAIYELIQTL